MRYFRTGEYRAPKAKEWFESNAFGPYQAELAGMGDVWILRAVDDEVTEYDPRELNMLSHAVDELSAILKRVKNERDEWKSLYEKSKAEREAEDNRDLGLLKECDELTIKLNDTRYELSKLRALCGEVCAKLRKGDDMISPMLQLQAAAKGETP